MSASIAPAELDRRRAASCGMFLAFAETQDPQIALAYLWEHPVLLWPRVWAELRQWIDTKDRKTAKVLRHRLQLLERFERKVRDGSEWPSDGPIERIAARLAREEISEDQALQLARSPETVDTLSPAYVGICAYRAQGAAENGDVQIAVRTFSILLNALDQKPDDPDWEGALVRAVGSWINTASLACHTLPDGRWFADAVRRGTAVLEVERQAAMRGALLHSLGILHLDPYVAGRNRETLDSELRRWQGRLIAVYGAVEAQEPLLAMPPLLDALGTAIDYLTRALPFRVGPPRGSTLKALAEALVWREAAGGLADRPGARAAAEEALKLLSVRDYPQRVAVVRNLLAYLNAAPTRPNAGAETLVELLFTTPADAVFAAVGESAAIERYAVGLTSLKGTPLRVFELVSRVWPLLTEARHEEVKGRFAGSLGQAAFDWAKAEGTLSISPAALAEAAQRLAETATHENWAPEKLPALLMGAAIATTEDDNEAIGLPAAAASLKLSPEPSYWREAFQILEAQLRMGAAVNALNAGAAVDAVQHYGAALVGFARLDFTDQALDTLSRLEDIAFEADQPGLARLVLSLAEAGPLLDACEVPGFGERLQYLWRKIFGHALKGGKGNLELAVLLFQAAKGSAFAQAALGHGQSGWRDDPGAQSLLRQALAFRARAPAAAHDDQIDDETVLCSFASQVATTGNSASDAAARLEQRFDRRVRTTIALSANLLTSWLRHAGIQALLGADTVLVTQYLATTHEGSPAMYTLLLTREVTFGTVGVMDFPGASVEMQGKDRNVSLHPQGMVVAELRRAIVEDPGPADVSSTADDLLIADRRLLGGGLAERLQTLRAAGKTHLCFHPHGAFHFHPLHLIGGSEACLADDWTVSKLPHPVLLARGLAPMPAPHRLAAFGLGFAGRQPRELSPLPGARAEAQAIAEVMGGEVYLDDAATKKLFIAALKSTRYVHVASHGGNVAAAPAFQKLHLAPSAGCDGVFYAYEAVGIDLRHVDLVTLSACETALGRFDIADNLRGLAANLLTSGVGAIVSTLWPVEDDVARTFFLALYKQIAADKPRLGAFRAAQLETRSLFPAFRDWGAFQYSGTW